MARGKKGKRRTKKSRRWIQSRKRGKGEKANAVLSSSVVLLTDAAVRDLQPETCAVTSQMRTSRSLPFEWLEASLQQADWERLVETIQTPLPKQEVLGPNFLNRQREILTSLARSRVYNTAVQNIPYVEAYAMRPNDFWSEDGWDTISQFSTADVWDAVARSISTTFQYRTPLPNPDVLLFGDRRRVAQKLRPVLDASYICCRDAELTAAGKNIWERIRTKGGLHKFPRGTARRINTSGVEQQWSSIFHEIRRLSAPERARIYEEDYFLTGVTSRHLANNAAYALFQAGYAERALYYIILSGLFPITSPSVLDGLGVYLYRHDLVVRCVAQIQVAGGRGVVLDASDPRHKTLYGEDAEGHSRLEKVRNQLLRDLDSKGPVPDVLRGTRILIRETVAEASFLPTEQLQASLFESVEQLGREIVAALLQEGKTALALEMLEASRSNVLRLYESLSNRRARLARAAAPENSATRPAEPIPVAGLAAAAIDEVTRCFSENTLALIYFAHPRAGGVFRLTRQSVDFVGLYGLAEGQDKLSTDLRQLLKILTSRELALGMRRLQDKQLRLLYDSLLRPALVDVGHIQNLIIVPANSGLFQLPFSALNNGESYLAERFNVSMMPTLTRYLAICGQPRRPVHSVTLLHGDQPELSGLALEESELKKAFPGSVSVCESAAAFLSGRWDGLCVLSGHGTIAPDRPLTAIVDLGSRGQIEPEALYRASLDRCACIILNVCDSGSVSVEGGQEIFGLTRGAISSGVGSVISTLLPVDDQVAAAFVGMLGKSLAAGLSTEQAYHDAVRALMKRPEWSNPWFWCAYQYHGPVQPTAMVTGPTTTLTVSENMGAFEESQLLYAQGYPLLNAGRLTEAEPYLVEADRRLNEVSTFIPGQEVTRTRALAKGALGQLYLLTDRALNALTLLFDAVTLWEKLLMGPERSQGIQALSHTTLNLSVAYLRVGRTEDALKAAAEGASFLRETAAELGVEAVWLTVQLEAQKAQCYHHLGMSTEMRGSFRSAELALTRGSRRFGASKFVQQVGWLRQMKREFR